MKIEFTNEEQEHLYTDGEMKLRCKEDTPEEMREALRVRLDAFNRWIDELNGVKT